MSPNSNNGTARQVLLDEIDQSLAALDSTPGASRCEAHSEVRTALRTLLRCQRAQLSLARDTMGIAAAVGAAAGGVIGGLLQLCK